MFHITFFMFTNCALVNFSEQCYLKPFQCLDITQVHSKYIVRETIKVKNENVL